eukprot:403337830
MGCASFNVSYENSISFPVSKQINYSYSETTQSVNTQLISVRNQTFDAWIDELATPNTAPIENGKYCKAVVAQIPNITFELGLSSPQVVSVKSSGHIMSQIKNETHVEIVMNYHTGYTQYSYNLTYNIFDSKSDQNQSLNINDTLDNECKINDLELISQSTTTIQIPQCFKLYIYEVELGKSKTFTQNNQEQFTFQPKKVDIGTYQISITVRDQNKNLIKIITFKVSVEKKKLANSCMNKDQCQPYILDINMEGVLTVFFPKSIGIPSSDLYSNVTKDLAFKIIFSSSSVDTFVQTVDIKEFTKQRMVLQLGFLNPQYISQDITPYKSPSSITASLEAMILKQKMDSKYQVRYRLNHQIQHFFWESLLNKFGVCQTLYRSQLIYHFQELLCHQIQ